MQNSVTVIGGGLAGCEAAYQLAVRNIKVTLCDIKPSFRTPAHTISSFAELVCSNSLRSTSLANACGLLKAEMEMLGSLIIEAAKKNSVEAGGALAVDRYAFSEYITNKISSFNNIQIICEEIKDIPKDGIVIIAAGPLCTPHLARSIRELTGREHLNFFDAAAPIVTAESVDMSRAFFASRYGKGSGDDYLNCPMTKEEYVEFLGELKNAQCAEVKDYEQNVFEGCMPVEVMAGRGEDTLRFGPLKPVGIYDPETNLRPYAVVQLRAENNAKSLYNLVGFQTHLKFAEQKRVFGLIPALKDAEFVRYGVMHKNTYINSPVLLNKYYQLKQNKNIYFAGQITGVEGYVESASSGLLCGIFAACDILNLPYPDFNDKLAIGALPNYICTADSENFQPMNINFGIIREPEVKIKNKIQNRENISNTAKQILSKIIEENDIFNI